MRHQMPMTPIHSGDDQFVTDKLRSYGAAMKDLTFRRRERAMMPFRRMRSLQKFASVQASVTNHFDQQRSFTCRPTSSSTSPPRPPGRAISGWQRGQ
jgi:transposase-like protein